MDDLFLLWLSLSLSGSLVALTLVLLRPFSGRFRKTWKYYLWLLVLLRLLLPFSPGGIVGGLFHQMEAQLSSQSEPSGTAPDISFPGGTEAPSSPYTGGSGFEASPPEPPIFAFAAKHIWSLSFLTVAALLFIRKAVGYSRFLSAMKRESREVTDGPLPDALRSVCTEMGFTKRVAVCVNPLVRAPLLVGVLAPRVVLPTADIPPGELAMIFKHELTHCRRGDFFYKWLAEIAVCLHWFNPLVYWVRKQINQDCELSCDEAVVSRLNAAERQAYGDTLLRSVSITPASAASLSLSGDGKLIKKRLTAIMQYRKASKRTVLTAAILTLALLCGTVFAGAYTAATAVDTQASAAVGPIQISGKDLAPGGKISMGSQSLTAGTECRALLTWSGSSKLTVLCTLSGNAAKSFPLESGKATVFQIEADGEYTVAVKNENTDTVGSIKGFIKFAPSAQTLQAQSVVYEAVEMRRYEGADGHPYIHDAKTNNTTKKMVGGQYGMLAFDKDGNPLKINWWSLDTDGESTYFYLDDTPKEIAPAATYDVWGGWSLNLPGTDSSVGQIAYVLYCDKEIIFEDGTVWTNPYFDEWRTIYEGKKTDVLILKSYYPHEQKITF